MSRRVAIVTLKPGPLTGRAALFADYHRQTGDEVVVLSPEELSSAVPALPTLWVDEWGDVSDDVWSALGVPEESKQVPK